MEQLLTPQELADYLGIPLGTLYQWNTKGTAPRRVKVGKYIRYRAADVHEWLAQRAAEDGAR